VISSAQGQSGSILRMRRRAVRTIRPATARIRSRSRLGFVAGGRGGQVAGSLGSPRPGRVRGHADQVCPAGAMLDRDQDVDPPEHDGVNRALEIGVVDAVAKPTETRRHIAKALAAAPTAQDARSNIPLWSARSRVGTLPPWPTFWTVSWRCATPRLVPSRNDAGRIPAVTAPRS